MKKKEEISFKPGELVRLKSDGDLKFTVTASKGKYVELRYVAGTKLCNDTVLAVQLESAEKKELTNFELTRLVLFLLEREARQMTDGKRLELKQHFESIFKLLATVKQEAATGH